MASFGKGNVPLAEGKMIVLQRGFLPNDIMKCMEPLFRVHHKGAE